MRPKPPNLPCLVLEGLPGVGKTTVMKSIGERPGWETVAELVTEESFERNDRAKEYLASRAGGPVIMDRYFLSTFAVLSCLESKPFRAYWEAMSEYAQPDVWLILDVPKRQLFRRWQARGRRPDEVWVEHLEELQEVYTRHAPKVLESLGGKVVVRSGSLASDYLVDYACALFHRPTSPNG